MIKELLFKITGKAKYAKYKVRIYWIKDRINAINYFISKEKAELWAKEYKKKHPGNTKIFIEENY